jgi:hypothetical protein
MFSPHHRFDNCRRLERAIRHLQQSNTIPENILKGYNRYHFALLHKLKSAKYYAEQLQSVLSTTSPEDIVKNSEVFLFAVNVSIDGFFYVAGSALDILAREVLTYFDIPMPLRVYYTTAHEQISARRAGDPILTRLANPAWKDEFSDYRNALTHELLIAGSYSINVDVDGSSQKTRIVFPLPDDPRVDPEARTYKRNSDVIAYCTATFRRLLSLINTIYGDLTSRIENNNALPI